ncbi:MAG: CPBP family intramembrane metalloprotease [Clostridiales bacterium]|nr:CPBP family intramembrane metalloprotease [Clostridiales bacterium]
MVKEIFGVPKIVEEAREIAKAKAAKSGKEGKKPGLFWILVVLITFGVLIFAEIISGVGDLFAELILKAIFGKDAITSTITMGVSLYSLIAITVIYMLYTKFIEGRPIRTLGFVKKGFAVQYLIGLVVGFAAFGIAVLFCKLTGSIDIRLSDNINPLVIIFVFGGWMIQGMEEEVCCRGFMLTSLARRYSVTFGVIANAVLFAALHLMNPGIGVLPFINLILFGLFASIMFVKTGNIWMCSAVHTIWNFVQGNFFGIQVSGNDLMDSIFYTDFVSGKELLNGGAFGLEGGLGVTVSMIIGIVILMLIPGKKIEVTAKE